MWKRTETKSRTTSLWAALASLWLWPTSVVAEQASAPEDAARPLPAWEEFVAGVLELDILNVPVWRMGLALLVLLLGYSLRGYLLDKLLKPLQAFIERTDNEFDDMFLEAVRRPLGWIINLVAIYVALVLVEPPTSIMTVSVLIMKTVGTVLVAWVVYRFINVGGEVLSHLAGHTDSEMDDHLVPLVKRVLHVVLFIIVGIAIIQQWGYDVTSLVAGLGIGGLAFALAAKSTLANWFGSVMIFTDRPFTMGDWITSSFGEGVVEEVGLRSTKIRTFTDTLITVPNSEIATCAVENCSAMSKRRIRTHIGLVYGTDHAQMKQILAGIEDKISQNDGLEEDNYYVHFDSFGASSLEVLLQCWALTTTYTEFLEIKQQLFLDIMEVVHEAGSDFAFPSQSLYVESPVRLDERRREQPAGATLGS
jgi:MscS family membrane protein